MSKAYATVTIIETLIDQKLRVAGSVSVVNPAQPQPNFGFDLELEGEPTKNAINMAIINNVQAVTASYGNTLPTADVLVFCL